MASLSRGISFRRQGSSGLSWTDTWSFNEEGVLVRTLKEDHHLQLPQRFAGCSLSRIHDSNPDEETLAEEKLTSSCSSSCCPPPAASYGRSSSSGMTQQLERSKSVGSSQVVPPAAHHKPAPSVFKWIKRALYKMKK